MIHCLWHISDPKSERYFKSHHCIIAHLIQHHLQSGTMCGVANSLFDTWKWLPQSKVSLTSIWILKNAAALQIAPINVCYILPSLQHQTVLNLVSDEISGRCWRITMCRSLIIRVYVPCVHYANHGRLLEWTALNQINDTLLNTNVHSKSTTQYTKHWYHLSSRRVTGTDKTWCCTYCSEKGGTS